MQFSLFRRYGIIILMIVVAFRGMSSFAHAAYSRATVPNSKNSAQQQTQIDLRNGIAAPDLAINFKPGKLAGATAVNPTSLQFGPDARLYVSQQNGVINVYTVVRNGPGNYSVLSTETISLLQDIPNHNDDGSLALSAPKARQVTGLLVTGTQQNPVIYVASSDPRGKENNTDPPSKRADSNSGILSRLTWNGSSWVKLDLVRGLPRSAEHHSANGLTIDKTRNTLYLMVGGNTNMGAPSTSFSGISEYALSGALLSIDLNAIGDTTYDLPTLDDQERTGVNDTNDPFGGNGGKNQAILAPGGPVQVYSPGWRNAYDILLNQAGRLYAVDNGPNAGWGNRPISCSNQLQDGGVNYNDNLHFVTGQGYYAGHPNPTRGNQSNTFNPTNRQSPVSISNPIECNYLIPGVEDGALTTYPGSTNGIAEYTADNFNGALQGNLLAVSYFSGEVWRMRLNANGTGLAAPKEVLLAGYGSFALDVIAQGDNDIFPGTIWVVTYFNDPIHVFEPADFDGGSSTCTGTDNASLDEDSDGYDNADEIDNAVNPCSAGSIPQDEDNDFTSNLLDPDDDNDGRNDNVDIFALDRQNGSSTNLPLSLTWDSGDPYAGGILGLGFMGVMTNGANYATLYDTTKIVAGGAAGILTFSEAPSGSAQASANSQQYGFQRGINIHKTSAPFVIHTRLIAPFQGLTPQGDMSMGIFFGLGDQDNYLKVALHANSGSGGVQVMIEQTGAVVHNLIYGPNKGVNILNANEVDLLIQVNPATGSAAISVTLNEGSPISLGEPLTLPETWFTSANKPAVGVIATSAGGTPFPASWDFLTVTTLPTGVSGATTLFLPLFAGSATPRQEAIASVAAPNEAPHAFAGLDQTVVDVTGEGVEGVRLSAFGSGDNDGTIQTYTWSSDTGISIPSEIDPLVNFPVGLHTVILTVIDNENATATDTVLIRVLPTGGSKALYRVNAGGGVLPSTGLSSVTWSADAYNRQSTFLTSGLDLRTYVTTSTLDMSDPVVASSSVPVELFQVERYLETGQQPGLQMSWDFPMSGTIEVDVRLYLAEIWYLINNTDNQRIFSVAVEGQTPAVFENINMLERFGANKAAILTYRLTVSDGNLDIDFISSKENPAIKAIEIMTTVEAVYTEFLYLPDIQR